MYSVIIPLFIHLYIKGNMLINSILPFIMRPLLSTLILNVFLRGLILSTFL